MRAARVLIVPLAAVFLVGGCSSTDPDMAGPAADLTVAASAPTATRTAAPTTAATATPSKAPRPTATASAAAPKQPASTASAKAPATKNASAKPAPKPSAANAAGRYVDVATWQADRAAFGGTDVVLFFHASWCPKCRDTDASAKAGMPSGLTLVKIDYDSATSLRQQYGVTLQHTFVQVDAGGGAVKKFVGTYTDNSVAWVKAQTV